jgi:hypothetical protein
LKKLIIIGLLSITFVSCSELEATRKEICEYKTEIIQAINLICSDSTHNSQTSLNNLGFKIVKTNKKGNNENGVR